MARPATKAILLLGDGLDRVCSATRWLALPVAVLLALQWPLREAVGAHSREANDLGQICFALYVACAVTAATRARAHIAVDLLSDTWSSLARAATLRLFLIFGVIPWFGFILFAGGGSAARSLVGLETFPDTYNPGYFIIKAAMMLFAGLGAMQALIDVIRPERLQPAVDAA